MEVPGLIIIVTIAIINSSLDKVRMWGGGGGERKKERKKERKEKKKEKRNVKKK